MSTTPVAERCGAHITWPALIVGSPPANDKKPSEIDKGFELTRLAPGDSDRGFHPKGNTYTMIVDSGASHHLVNGEQISRLQGRIGDHKMLKKR